VSACVSKALTVLARWHPVNSDLSRWLVTKQWIALLVSTLTPGVWYSLPCPETSPSILPTLSHPFTGYTVTLFEFPLTATCCLLLPFCTPTAYLAYIHCSLPLPTYSTLTSRCPVSAPSASLSDSDSAASCCIGRLCSLSKLLGGFCGTPTADSITWRAPPAVTLGTLYVQDMAIQHICGRVLLPLSLPLPTATAVP
jgi:hypothetical protein